ncbi:hypothetical protein PBAL39_17159 [Pedobacter sp. BAL39]|uniref:DUF4932 domain-containing protein n=1 Tax=Pedobacter sp. BAL39 TaxID=391596 RepID=UPI000155A2B2|nr:DUF4932 domain-containing protein [Pedobacter sp. BAL39]EDM34021.1 hypothetical protein PBAL39_17159 [Pedobacter sp. BAL39]
MMKIPVYLALIFLLPFHVNGQLSSRLSPKVTVAVNTNIETYFIAEKLAVEHIGNYVFSNKEVQFTHQPIVHFGLKTFLPWKDSPVILRIAELLKQMREILHDNSQEIEYLTYRKPFPATGFRWPPPVDLPLFSERYPGARAMGEELADSLASFYKQARVGSFLKQNVAFYKGALAEATKHISVKAIPFMEKWYGKQFAGYEFYLMPGMPITPGDDNYRAFGPKLTSPNGEVSAMIFSSSIQLPLLNSLSVYRQFGFDNAEVIRFLTVHELGHSFVNPVIEPLKQLVQRDTSLFTATLARHLEKSYISTWETCLVEHLVRLGEIRIAKSMGDIAEENRIRKLHVSEFGFVLLPMLEKVIEKYESDRARYPDFKSFLPEIFSSLHQLQPADIDALVKAATPLNP